MFEWGFWELVVIAVVALIVIGPERLPKVARLAGHWLGRARRTLASVKHEIDREMRTEELQSILERQRQTLNQPIDRILETPAPTASFPAEPGALPLDAPERSHPERADGLVAPPLDALAPADRTPPPRIRDSGPDSPSPDRR